MQMQTNTKRSPLGAVAPIVLSHTAIIASVLYNEVIQSITVAS